MTPTAIHRRLATVVLTLVACAPPLVAAAPAANDDPLAPVLAGVERRDALAWLERLDRDLAVLPEAARRAHWRPLADALLAAGDARGALLISRAAPHEVWSTWLRSSVDGRIDANDAATAIAIAHLLARLDAPDPLAARRERVRALCLVGRADAARDAAEGASALLAQVNAWTLEGRARSAATTDARLAALAQLQTMDSARAHVVARAVFDHALETGAIDAALELLARHTERGADDEDRDESGPRSNGPRSNGRRPNGRRPNGTDPTWSDAPAAAALELWDLGRRTEAIACVDPSLGSARHAETLVRVRDVPSSAARPLFESLHRRDVDGRARLGLALAHAHAREGEGELAWERVAVLSTLDARARFDLAVDLERGGDTRRATVLAGSDRWSSALLELWRAQRDGRDTLDALARAQMLAPEASGRAAELAELLLAFDARRPAAETIVAALDASPVALDPDELMALVRLALRADGGRRLHEVHAAHESPGARAVLAAACVRAALVR